MGSLHGLPRGRHPSAACGAESAKRIHAFAVLKRVLERVAACGGVGWWACLFAIQVLAAPQPSALAASQPSALAASQPSALAPSQPSALVPSLTPPDAGAQWREAIESMVAEHPMLAGQNPRIDYPASLPRWPVCKSPRASATRQGVPVGRVSIALRCGDPRWQGSIQVVVAARRTHYSAARALQAGTIIDADAIVAVESDWASLPDDVVTEPEQVLGRGLVRSVSAGTALTLNLVRQTAVIRNGERVRVQMSGNNFVVAGEGTALQAGNVGEQIRVKMGGGQVVTAVIIRQGQVELRIE